MINRIFIRLVFLLCSIFIGLFGNEPYTHLVVLGDPHLPGKNITAKEKVLQTINGWQDVDSVVAIGDLCEFVGDEAEYTAVKAYFRTLNKPLFPIVGNHDFIYADTPKDNEKLQKATHEEQKAKLETFSKTFGLKKPYYSLIKEGYFLVFLSTDSPKNLAAMGEKQLLWFENELQTNMYLPTIVFFHAPLENTLNTYKHFVNTPSFVAQPAEKIREIILKNPQLFLWVSGHTHTSPKEPSFASTINLYENQVTNIHNTDMKKETIWTNSLFLFPDKVVVKTYNHTTHLWQNELERSFFLPKLSKKR